MNLYRSFGDLLETWVTEGGPILDLQSEVGLEGRRPDSTSGDSITFSGTTLQSKLDTEMPMRSESEDSGVEMATVIGEDGLPSSSPPYSPVLPSPILSSSLSFCTRSLRPRQELATEIHLKVEQALRRTERSSLGKTPQYPGNQHVAPRQQCYTPTLTTQKHTETPTYGAGHRSRSLMRTVSSSVLTQDSQLHRRAVSLHHRNNLPAQTHTEVREEGEVEGEGLGLGLGYLEHVCRILEEIARLQICNRGLQVEMEALRAQRAKLESQTAVFNQGDRKAVEKSVPSANQRLAAKGREDLSCQTSRKNGVVVFPDFRRRSASDTQVFKGHLRKVKTEKLLEPIEDNENEELKKEQGSRNKAWKLKIGSLKRQEATQSDSEKNSQQMHSSWKGTSGYWLGQLFRRRTVPE